MVQIIFIGRKEKHAQQAWYCEELFKIVLKKQFFSFSIMQNAHQVFVFGNLWLILKN